jgi:hypothetical protein
VFRASSSVAPSPSGVAVQETLANLSHGADHRPGGPRSHRAAAPSPARINCGGACFDWRTDNAHCGGLRHRLRRGRLLLGGKLRVHLPGGGDLLRRRVRGHRRGPPQLRGAAGQACAEGEVLLGRGVHAVLPRGDHLLRRCLPCHAIRRAELRPVAVRRARRTRSASRGGVPLPRGRPLVAGLCRRPTSTTRTVAPAATTAPSAVKAALLLLRRVLLWERGFRRGRRRRAPEAPLCQVPPSETTIPPGGTATQCTPVQGFLVKEVATTVRVCGEGIPGGEARCPDGSPPRRARS